MVPKIMHIFRTLISGNFTSQYSVLGTAESLEAQLSDSLEVDALRDSLSSEVISEATLRDFVETLVSEHALVSEHVAGVLFPFDTTFCALAVALKEWAGQFAEEFLCDLSRIDPREFPMSARVAKICRVQHAARFAGTNDSQSPLVVSGWQGSEATFEISEWQAFTPNSQPNYDLEVA